MKTRITAILLLAALLFASCGGGKTPASVTSTSTSAPGTSAETVETELLPEVPDVKFDGESLRVMYS